MSPHTPTPISLTADTFRASTVRYPGIHRRKSGLTCSPRQPSAQTSAMATIAALTWATVDAKQATSFLGLGAAQRETNRQEHAQ